MTKKNIKNSIQELYERNKRVETDKAWETSFTRRFIIVVVTYLIMGFFLISINAPNPWLNALVPSSAYILSTLTLPFVKKVWLNNTYKEK